MGVLSPHTRRKLRLLVASLIVGAATMAGTAPASADTGLLARWALDVENVDQDLHTSPEAAGVSSLTATFSSSAGLVPGGRFGNALDLPLPPRTAPGPPCRRSSGSRPRN